MSKDLGKVCRLKEYEYFIKLGMIFKVVQEYQLYNNFILDSEIILSFEFSDFIFYFNYKVLEIIVFKQRNRIC